MNTTALQTEAIAAFKVHHFDAVESTNSLALDCTEDAVVFVADVQTAGRGRRAAVWHSAPGLGLWMSIALRRPPQDLGIAAVLAMRAAVGQCLQLGAAGPLAVKWPNDLLAAGRKVCGILVEHRAGTSAVGIGLNLAHTPGDFPEELRGIATSLHAVYGAAPDRQALLRAILAEFRARIVPDAADSVFAEWRAALGLEGRAIARGDLRGVVEAVERDGALRVRTADGLARVDAGVVEILDE